MSFWRKRKTIEEHLAPITNIINGLKEHANFYIGEQQKHEEAIVRHVTESNLAKTESDRAASQALMIEGIFR